MMFRRMPSHAHRQTTVDVSPIVTKKEQIYKNPAKDFCWWNLDGVVVCRRSAVVDGSLDLSARATIFFI